MKIFKKQKGAYLPFILVMSSVFIIFAYSVIAIANSNLRLARHHWANITSMEIAEAGINYYLWHLSHNNTDYCDGQTCPATAPYGPYHHEYKDSSGNTLGAFDLYITPPNLGNNQTIVKSVGQANPNTTGQVRTLEAVIGMPSFTKYTLLVNNSQLWLGVGEKVTGNVFVQYSGCYNEGEITGDAYSTETTYNGWFGTQPGLAGPGQYDGLKQFPVPPIDMNQVNVDIAKIRQDAKVNHAGDWYDTTSGNQGYHVILQANNYKLSQVKKYDTVGNPDGYDITSETTSTTYPYPASGIIFLEDNAWIEGTVNNKQITIVVNDEDAGSKKKSIYVPHPIKYTSYNGSDKIGLISQKDVIVTKNADTNMEIDAAILAKDGIAKIENYGELKTKIKIYGSVAHTSGLIWSYGSGGGHYSSGFVATETVADLNNVLNPPPRFPTTGGYSVLTWREH